MSEFMLGVIAAVVSLIPAGIITVLLVKYAMRTASRNGIIADNWRTAATNATILARVLELASENKKSDDDDGVFHGG